MFQQNTTGSKFSGDTVKASVGAVKTLLEI